MKTSARTASWAWTVFRGQYLAAMVKKDLGYDMFSVIFRTMNGISETSLNAEVGGMLLMVAITPRPGLLMK